MATGEGWVAGASAEEARERHPTAKRPATVMDVQESVKSDRRSKFIGR
jgi:hypothetical protein